MTTSTERRGAGTAFTVSEELLAVQMRRAFPGTPDYEVRIFATNGWTAEDWVRIEALAAWADGEGLLGWAANRQTLSSLLSAMWESLVRHGSVAPADAHRWVALLAGSPDPEAYRLGGMRAAENGPRDTGMIGPLAYAAGLPLAEARKSVEAGRLDFAALEMLASLRGWRIPPPALIR